MASRPKILFHCHGLEPVGGDRAVASWMLHALAPLYDVTILTWNPPNLAEVDRIFGTAVSGYQFEILTPSSLASWLVEKIPDNSHHQRANYLVRLGKQRIHEFDAVVSCTFESDMGQPVIQYIHYPYIATRIDACNTAGDAPLPQRMRGLLTGRTQPWMLISGYSFERLRANHTLSNSQWTRTLVQRLCGIESDVLYPPAPGDFRDTLWDQRRNWFVALGRLNPGKRQDWMIETMSLVRRHIPDVELHICGFVDRDSPDYLRRLQTLASTHAPWVKIHADLSRQQLIELMAQCRYGMHALIDEHFGIAPAEMARAGCIPFVHASGGQVEIVNRDPRLCYTTGEDAAAKIVAVLRDPVLQQELRTAVRERSELFHPQRFVHEFRRHVAEFIASRKARQSA